MLYNFWVFAHNIGTHFYTLPFIALGLVVIVTQLVHHHNQKKRDEEFEEELNEKLGKKSVK